MITEEPAAAAGCLRILRLGELNALIGEAADDPTQ
jgi:hypothetical protein